jgi:membrane fusion protein, multidrug efflux system
MKILAIIPALICLGLSACNRQTDVVHHKTRKITAVFPQARSVSSTERYSGRIQSHHYAEVRAVQTGYLEEILVARGQTVRQGDLLFKIQPVNMAKLEVENAEVTLAELEFDRARKLCEEKLVTQHEVALIEAKLARAKAQLQAELSRNTIPAPFDGIVDRLQHQSGSLVERGEVLTTISDSSVMRVYFNVPESRYLEYMADQNKEDLKIELELAHGNKFQQIGKIGSIHADFNKETATIPFRADFPNPDRLLRHGQMGTVLISREQHDTIVIPQRATFENLDKRYVYVIDDTDVVHQREIFIEKELEDLFVVTKGVGVDDKIVLDGIIYLRDGDKVEYQPEQTPSN